MYSIRVDIEDLISKLECMIQEDYSTVELEIEDNGGMYRNLNVKGISMQSEEPIYYGTIPESDIEL